MTNLLQRWLLLTITAALLIAATGYGIHYAHGAEQRHRQKQATALLQVCLTIAKTPADTDKCLNDYNLITSK